MFDPYKETEKVNEIINIILEKFPLDKTDAQQIHSYRTFIRNVKSSINILHHGVEKAAMHIEDLIKMPKRDKKGR